MIYTYYNLYFKINFYKKYLKDVPAPGRATNYSKKLRRVRSDHYSSEI
jgi:hypothetical protein